MLRLLLLLLLHRHLIPSLQQLGANKSTYIWATCHLPPAICHMPLFTCLLPPATCHLPHATCHLQPFTCQQPTDTWHLSPTTYHQQKDFPNKYSSTQFSQKPFNKTNSHRKFPKKGFPKKILGNFSKIDTFQTKISIIFSFFQQKNVIQVAS